MASRLPFATEEDMLRFEADNLVSRLGHDHYAALALAERVITYLESMPSRAACLAVVEALETMTTNDFTLGGDASVRHELKQGLFRGGEQDAWDTDAPF